MIIAVMPVVTLEPIRNCNGRPCHTAIHLQVCLQSTGMLPAILSVLLGNDLPLDMLGFSLNDPYRSGSESLSSSCSSSSIDGNQSDGGQWAEYSYGYPKPMTSDELLRSDLELFYPVENSPSPPPPPQSGYGNVLQSMLSNSTLKCDPLSPEVRNRVIDLDFFSMIICRSFNRWNAK